MELPPKRQRFTSNHLGLLSLVLASGYALGFLSSTAISSYNQLLLVKVSTLPRFSTNATFSAVQAMTRTSPRSAVSTQEHSLVSSGDPAANHSELAQGSKHVNSTVPSCNSSVQPLPPMQQSSGAHIHHSELDHVATEGPTVCDKGVAKGLKLNVTYELVAPIVVLGHNRVSYLAHCLMVLLKYWSNDPTNTVKFPLYISVDGGHQRSLNLAVALRESSEIQVITRVRNTAQCNDGDCNLTAHFKMLLQLFFQCLQSPRLIFLEEDLQVAPDFLSYFTATAPLLDQDPSLWCVSAWNDHGQSGRALDNTALYRTDIIPGLGWLLNRKQAMTIIDKWPEVYWDDWMREPHIRQGRQCVFPEISRTYHFGRVGTHFGGNPNDTFFDKALARILISSEDVDWSRRNLTYLLKANYEVVMDAWLSNATKYDESLLGDLRDYCHRDKAADTNATSDLLITYPWNSNNHGGFAQVAEKLPGMMTDIRGQRPRASYNGIVMVRCRGRRLFLKPG